jgi:hypothetical protein
VTIKKGMIPKRDRAQIPRLFCFDLQQFYLLGKVILYESI